MCGGRSSLSAAETDATALSCSLLMYKDASDPDLSLPNKLHLLQTAEGIRQAGHPDWFQLVGLIHDMGKIMFLWGTDTDGQGTNQQWALAGDTFVVGCKVPDTVVFPEFNHTNPDMRHLCYSTLYGMYEPHCGLDQLCLAWGHDEYMFRMLVANECSIPREGLDMIRYHSAYPLHSSDGKGAYAHLMKDDDEERLQWIRQFNRFDLYTKDDNKDIRQDMESLWPYYKQLLDKYGLGGTLKW